MILKFDIISVILYNDVINVHVKNRINRYIVKVRMHSVH